MIAQVPYATVADVDRAVQARAQRFLEVARRAGGGPRSAALPVQDAAREASLEVAAILTRENGKTLEDAKRSAPRNPDGGSGLRHAQLDDGRIAEDVAQGIDCTVSGSRWAYAWASRRSIFPCMVPMWMYPFAIACWKRVRPEAVGKSAADTHAGHANCWLMPVCRRAYILIHGDREAVDALLSIRWCGRFRSWGRRPLRNIFTRQRRPKANACRRWAGRRITWWLCPMPTC